MSTNKRPRPGWTYGMELELADYDRRRRLPKGFENNRKDFTVVNSNGIANDPKDRLYHHGGEINTPPTATIKHQVDAFEGLLEVIPEAAVNYRSNLHIHIRVPGLREDLPALKRVQKYIHDHYRKLFPIVQPIAAPPRWAMKSTREFEGALKRYQRMLVSHHTLLSSKRVAAQLDAPTIDEFFEREVPHRDDGSPCWHLQPRVCVNLRQLRETDTIEFRHGFGTLDPVLTFNQLTWCDLFLKHALDNAPVDAFIESVRASAYEFPRCGPYSHDLEMKYRATCHDTTNTQDQIKHNIALILKGEWTNSAVER